MATEDDTVEVCVCQLFMFLERNGSNVTLAIICRLGGSSWTRQTRTIGLI